MAKYVGKDGVITAGGNAIANINSYSLEEASRPIAQRDLGDEWDVFSSALGDHPKAWTASVNAFTDDADAAQAAAVAGAELSFVFRPRGTGVGLPEMTGNGIITGATRASESEGMYTLELSIQGNGALTHATQ